MFKARQYQIEISDKGYKILNTKGILILSMEVRTGKTLTALLTCEKAICKNVLFVTKKKAIGSIQSDYDLLSPGFDITIINYESIHKLEHNDFDIVIIDESHSLGAYPKPSLRTKRIKKIIGNKRMILLSGTLTPESFSQIFHQLWISDNTPFTETNFYKWAKNYVDVKQVYRSHGQMANDYSNAKIKLIQPIISNYILTYTQKEAGFTSKVKEIILKVRMKQTTYDLVKILERDLVFTGKKGGVILADTPVKLLQKVTQLYSGTIKLEDGSATIIDTTKADFIKSKFQGKKIAIFYVYKEELSLLQQTFNNLLTTDLEEFNTTDKNIALQVVSGREGISLKKADALVMFNIQHSATSYWQSRDRMTTKEREVNNVYWVFSEGGIEEKIYNVVLTKKSFTTKHYDRSKVPIETY